MQVFNDIKELEDSFLEEKKRGRKMAYLYEIVQQASGLLQRMYLMVTAGGLCIETRECTAREILKDLLEMSKTIQNPIRGLFLRYFMLKKMKDKMPDKGSPYAG